MPPWPVLLYNTTPRLVLSFQTNTNYYYAAFALGCLHAVGDISVSFLQQILSAAYFSPLEPFFVRCQSLHLRTLWRKGGCQFNVIQQHGDGPFGGHFLLKL